MKIIIFINKDHPPPNKINKYTRVLKKQKTKVKQMYTPTDILNRNQ